VGIESIDRNARMEGYSRRPHTDSLAGKSKFISESITPDQ